MAWDTSQNLKLWLETHRQTLTYGLRHFIKPKFMAWDKTLSQSILWEKVAMQKERGEEETNLNSGPYVGSAVGQRTHSTQTNSYHISHFCWVTNIATISYLIPQSQPTHSHVHMFQNHNSHHQSWPAFQIIMVSISRIIQHHSTTTVSLQINLCKGTAHTFHIYHAKNHLRGYLPDPVHK
jgi:hypothetical protein